MKWTEPKTNWKSTDYFNIGDYNRIKNNLIYLSTEIGKYIKPISLSDMGSDITSYDGIWAHTQFNTIENNVSKIASVTEVSFTPKQFFPNGVFITWDELNRIEEACKNAYKYVKSNTSCIPILEFRLGNKQIGNR